METLLLGTHRCVPACDPPGWLQPLFANRAWDPRLDSSNTLVIHGVARVRFMVPSEFFDFQHTRDVFVWKSALCG